ncbi:MAG: hypothetical protein HZA50_13035 [Planctomycetes bacterium]|nr:hypothetical protein [Planctomycetota bacterium]
MKLWKLPLTLLLAALFAGCIEMTAVYTLNPDSSGKVDFDISMAQPPDTPKPDGVPEPPKQNPEAQAKKMLKNMVEDKKFDAWSGVSWEIAKDKKVHVKATAFFKDLAAVGNDGPSGKVTWKKNEKGEMVLQMDMRAEAGDKPPAGEMTQEQIDEAITRTREQWKMTREIMAKMMGQMKLQMVFKLPGQVSEVNGLAKNADGSVKFEFNGQKYFDLMDKLIADDKAMTELIKAGKNPFSQGTMSEGMCEAMFGTKGPLKAVVTGEPKPQFDYKAEMEKAKAAMPEMIKGLKLDEPPAESPDEKPAPKQIPGAEPAQ